MLFNAKHNTQDLFDFIRIEKYYSKEYYHGYAKGILGELLYEIAECKDCHFIYLTEVLNDIGMELLYNDWLDKELLRAHYSHLPFNIAAENILKLIKVAFNKKNKINLLDFGAGYGNFCSIATKSGFNTFAFDLSSDKNDHMDYMGVTIIDNFDKSYGYFDFIWVNQVLEHLSNPLEVLIELSKCLRDTGIIYIGVPDCKDIKQILKINGLTEELFKLLSPHQHINAFTNNSLKILSTNAGLKALSIVDFIKFLDTSLNSSELKFLTKRIIKNSSFGTDLFFRKN